MKKCAPANRLGVLVADSNPLHSQLLAASLRRRSRFRVVTCPTETEDVLKAIESNTLHVVLIAAHNLDDARHKTSMIRSLHLARPEIAQVLMLNDYDQSLVLDAFRFGIRGLFCWSESFQMLCKCVECVCDKQIWANQEHLQWLVDALTQQQSLPISDPTRQLLLSDREQLIVALVAEGLSNRNIASELALTENTVKKYLFLIFNKLGVSSRVELALYATRNGMCLKFARIPSESL